jgi:hydrogenase maturation protease
MLDQKQGLRTLVVGIGSLIRGDDGVGIHVIRRLAQPGLPEHVHTLEAGTAGISLLDFVEGYDRLIIIDAIVTGAPAGTIYELRGSDIARTIHLSAGHEADLPTALALGEKLSRTMPKEVIVLAIEAGSLDAFSENLSAEVEAAIPEVLGRTQAILVTVTNNDGPTPTEFRR